MDALIRSAARGLCLPLLDVWALDRDAGFYSGKQEDFHVPQVGSMQSALAMLLVLTAAPVSSHSLCQKALGSRIPGHDD